MQNAGDYLAESECKVEEATKRSPELLKQLKDAETEIETLKQNIIDLKQNIIDLKPRLVVYIPVKGDVVDKKLAEYINNYPERSKLKIMFMRESEGIYSFGTKRVYLRVDKDKISSIFLLHLIYYSPRWWRLPLHR
jgi:esterase/lipase